MPHYSDGTEAQLGDMIEGRGYNVPHPIQGILIGITPGQDSCNVRVAHMTPSSTGKHALRGFHGELVHVDIDVEYGQADAFRLVHRQGA